MTHKFLKTYTVYLLGFLIGCSGAKYDDLEEQPVPKTEDLIYQSLEVLSEVLPSCEVERKALLASSKQDINFFVGRIKQLAHPKLHAQAAKLENKENKKEDRPKIDAEYLKEIMDVIESEAFKDMLLQMANFVDDIGNNKNITGALQGIHEDVYFKEPGDKIAELLTKLAQDSNKRNALFSAAKAALCEDADALTLSYALDAPETVWDMLPELGYLVSSSLMTHIEKLLDGYSELTLPPVLEQAINKPQIGKPKICEIESLAPYQEHFLFIADMLAQDKQASPRPLRRFMNMLSKLKTMNLENSCTGFSLDDLNEKNIQNGFKQTAQLIRDEEWGIVGRIQKMKPKAS